MESNTIEDFHLTNTDRQTVITTVFTLVFKVFSNKIVTFISCKI